MATMGLGHAMKFAPIAVSNSGDTTVVAAVSGKQIKVVGFVLVAAGTVSVKFKGGATDLTGAMPLAANGGVAATGDPEAVMFETAAGAALIVNLSGGVACGGFLNYLVEA